ncbi:spore germination protein [Fredinandcohnia sp. QZ13]|uniref:spore germination protein n=1 Tax=Fredinandcohnia sp. QZ13 TaxID=3073144 RepID=UPI0028536BEB|nr:spore germination protein [Fredinandcohnia sp. QZ13]MDR4886107.1 spore germination protein [Fredinandcohnia sp. QZ13]
MLFSPVNLNVGGIKINSVDNGAVVNLGPSQHLDQFVSYKRNQGVGEKNGDLQQNLMSFSEVWDTDVLDSLSNKSSVI